MAFEAPGKCPVCDGGLEVARLHCLACGTAIEGRFEPCRFCRLSRENRDFAEVFIRCRGNIREVERELGISYPTVRGRLEQLVLAMGFQVGRDQEPASTAPGPERAAVLEQLGSGDITVDEALAALRVASDRGGVSK